MVLAEHFAIQCTEPILAGAPIGRSPTFVLQINCNNTIIAAGHENYCVTIYDAMSGQGLAMCPGHELSPWTLSFHPHLPYLLASGCIGGCVHVWDLEFLNHLPFASPPSTQLPLIYPKISWKHPRAIASLAFHTKLPVLVVAWAQEIEFLNWNTGTRLASWRFASEHARTSWVQSSTDGTHVYIAVANPFVDSMGPYVAWRSRKTLDIYDNELEEPVSRLRLLNFLLTRPGDWFKSRGICKSCMLRLCWWAAGLISEPQFPHRRIPNARNVRGVLEAVSQVLPVAQQVLGAFKSSVYPEFVSIIEDMPAMRWILENGAKGVYCCNQKRGRPTRSLCCSAHARDLLLTHRQILKHSLCRLCLTSFWQWANGGNVDWWSDSTSTNTNDKTAHASMTPPNGIDLCSFCTHVVECQKSQQNNCKESTGVPRMKHAFTLATPSAHKRAYQESNLEEKPSKPDIRVCFKCGRIDETAQPFDSPWGILNPICSDILFSTHSDPKHPASYLQSLYQCANEVIASTYSGLGEHNTASNICDPTYRICRWPLQISGSFDADEPLTLSPGGMTFAYENDVVIVPRARIFNDSSVSISPDGKLVAALTVSESKNSNINVGVYRLESERCRGELLYVKRFIPASNPVCLTFSPSGGLLVVGMACSSGNSSNGPAEAVLAVIAAIGHHSTPTVANVYIIDPSVEATPEGRKLRALAALPHPLREVAESTINERFQRGLELHGGLTLNTIIWHPRRIIYGTSSGLVVLLRPQSHPARVPLSLQGQPTVRDKKSRTSVHRYALSARSQELAALLMRSTAIGRGV